MTRLPGIVLLAMFFAAAVGDSAVSQQAPLDASFEQAQQLESNGNYAEALEQYRALLEAGRLENAQLARSYQNALRCLQQLNRVDQFDALREALAEQYSDNWQMLAVLAKSCLEQPHYGYRIAGEFQRGSHRGGGQVLNATARDRVRGLQLYRRAFDMLEDRPNLRGSAEAAKLVSGFARALLYGNDYNQAWQLQQLTDLSELPDYEVGWHPTWGDTQGAPVDSEGNPIFYDVPSSWDSAANDGQRWRWLLVQWAEWRPEERWQAELERTKFLQSQFGVHTLQQYQPLLQSVQSSDPTQESGTFALHTLSREETIARLATGVRRFELPDEHNHLKILQRILDEAERTSTSRRRAAQMMAELFENRRQYPQAAEYWQLVIEIAPNQQRARRALDQVLGNWGRFEPVMSQSAGSGATVDFRYRNGKRVEFVARRIEVKRLLDDVKAQLASNPDKLDWQQLQLENLGYRLVIQGQDKYLGPEVARWSLDLEPLQKHFDRRITVNTPLEQPGAYLVTSQMENGNSTNIVLWLTDTAIVQKPLVENSLFYVADAETGKPLANCQVEFFGFWQQHLGENNFRLHTKAVTRQTGPDGMIELANGDQSQRYQWLATVSKDQGHFAHWGFRGVWSGDYHEQAYQQVKVFSITDRPVYRPAQKVHFKFWVRNAQYDSAEVSQFASQQFQVEIRNPRDEKVYATQMIADSYGGLSGTWEIPAGATLGQYRFQVVNHGGGTFRVEEYKKPEYQVSIAAPEEPVELGEKFQATISADYYFGSPVTEATVRYKVLRTPHEQQWFPPMPWDWLYGPGYWWSGVEYDWLPGWSRWACPGPPPWYWQRPTPPEVVAQGEVPIGPDGEVQIEVDTALAEEFHPDEDHRYLIEAEVVDQSRRTVVASGEVFAARQPYRVFVWTGRNYYRAGDTIEVHAAARTLGGEPVSGKGRLELLKIKYDNGKPVETEVGNWQLDTGIDGSSSIQIKASEAGQYRLSYKLSDGEDHRVEGGHVLTVIGEGFDGTPFRFNDIEIVPQKREYRPGEKVALQLNSNRTGSAILLFLRPSNGVYLPPQLVALNGKSTIVEFDVTEKDMPNFYVEAATVHGGKLHTATREIFVPPVKRVLNVELQPDSETYQPGEEATVSVKLTDLEGQPYVGSLALSVYDKALDYIAGDSQVPDIREFFWKWRRQHRPQSQTNLDRWGHVQVRRNQPVMQNLGIFGESVPEEVPKADLARSTLQGAPGEFGLAESAPATAFAGRAAAMDTADQDASETVQPEVRANFADTAYWAAAIETDSAGLAEVTFPMPENLTTWKIHAWAMGQGTRVGEAAAEAVSRKNIIVRMQAPRFFVETDEVVLSANVHNYLPTSKQVTVELELFGDCLVGPEHVREVIEIPSGGAQRIDWRVTALREGTASVRMSALTDQESDAVEMDFPVHVHGMLKTDSFTGVVRRDQSGGSFTFEVPADRRPEQSSLTVRYTPTLAGTMVDALPYLIEYPYGCTEQTLNRFLPAVITQQTLKRLNVNLADIRAEREEADQPLEDEAAPPKKTDRQRDPNPVFDEQELDKIVRTGVNRLLEMQLSDGGWGWFSGWGERSAPHTTAVVVRGLLIAQRNGVQVPSEALERGLGWLQNYQAEQLARIKKYSEDQSNPQSKAHADNLDALVYMVLAEAGRDQPAMREYLYRDRSELAVYSLAAFGLGLERLDQDEMFTMVLRNLSQYVQQDDENQTAWLELPHSGWWYWYGSEFEAQAYYLKLLAATQPRSEITSRLVKYLVNNRQHANYWKSTRDTALVVEALADYVQARGEVEPDATIEVYLDGELRKQVAVDRSNLFSFEDELILTGAELTEGEHIVEIRKQGNSPVYFNGYLENFTLEDDITAAGLEIKVQRRYFKLTPKEITETVPGGRGQVVAQQGEKYERTPLADLEHLESGDLVEVELVVESKNDYEYIVLEDLKAAGCEPVAVRSGYSGNELNAYMELRDDRVTLFLDRLARGTHSLSYRLRAEIPGQFSALPTKVWAMYAPELKANSAEAKIEIVD